MVHGMDYELWQDLQQRRMEEAQRYRLRHQARRAGRSRRARRLLTVGGVVAVAIVLGSLLVTANGAG